MEHKDIYELHVRYLDASDSDCQRFEVEASVNGGEQWYVVSSACLDPDEKINEHIADMPHAEVVLMQSTGSSDRAPGVIRDRISI